MYKKLLIKDRILLRMKCWTTFYSLLSQSIMFQVTYQKLNTNFKLFAISILPDLSLKDRREFKLYWHLIEIKARISAEYLKYEYFSLVL